MTRSDLITHFSSVHGVVSNGELLGTLQDMGLISDDALAIEDCAECDLARAWERAIGHGGEIA